MTPSLPDAGGHFGPYGGRFVPEVLMAPIEELEQAYLAARAGSGFSSRTERSAGELRRPAHAALLRQPPDRTPGRRAHLDQARGPAAHRRAQDQQQPGPGTAGEAHGQEAHHRRDRRGPARRGHRHGLRAAGPGVRGLHGRGRHAPPAAQRLPHAPAGREGGGRQRRQPHAQGRHQRSHARLGDQRRRHLLPARLGARLASVPDDGARFPEGDRRRGAPPDSGSRRPPARCRAGLRGRRLERHRHFSRVHPRRIGRAHRHRSRRQGAATGRARGALQRRIARRAARLPQLSSAG